MSSADSFRTSRRLGVPPGGPVVLDPSLGATDACAAPALASPLSGLRGNGGRAFHEWDALIDALAEPLHEILECTRAGTSSARSAGLAARTHGLALDCATALNLLEAALACDRTVRRRLERELGDAKVALTQVQLEFDDSHAGELQARHLALHDDLTALPNRRQCRELLDHALASAAARQTTAALLFMDLDGFKAINDSHGHGTGDEVLRIVAARLTRAVRVGDVVGRLSGDEFVCLPSGPVGAPQLAHLALKLFDAVSAPLSLNNLQLRVRPSIGVAIFPFHASSTDGLLKAADAAMYRAKVGRTGFAFASPEAKLPLD
jgi:diguanylate cyclase (GGDEF)-like protein